MFVISTLTLGFSKNYQHCSQSKYSLIGAAMWRQHYSLRKRHGIGLSNSSTPFSLQELEEVVYSWFTVVTERSCIWKARHTAMGLLKYLKFWRKKESNVSTKYINNYKMRTCWLHDKLYINTVVLGENWKNAYSIDQNGAINQQCWESYFLLGAVQNVKYSLSHTHTHITHIMEIVYYIKLNKNWPTL
jgi:hypothetical protein